MTVQVVRFATADEAKVAEVETAIGSPIAAIDEAQPAGTRHAARRLADGVAFLLVLELADGAENPLPSVPEARALVAYPVGVADRSGRRSGPIPPRRARISL